MAIETFSVEDTLDDGEVYGQFTNQEGNSGNGRVSGGVYITNHDDVADLHDYLVTNNIGSIFTYQVEFITATSGYLMMHAGIYLGATPPTAQFTVYANTLNNLINVWLRRSTSTYRLEVFRTSNAGVQQWWNFSTDSWGTGEDSWDGFAPNNTYRFTITRNGTNTVLTIYDVTGSALIETITSINTNMLAISNNAYFYFGVPIRGVAASALGNWDNAGFEEAGEEYIPRVIII